MNTLDAALLCKSAEEFAEMLRDLAQQRAMAEAEIADLERVHDQIVHRIEAGDCLYAERARLATRLSHACRERRKLKDWLAETRCVLDYMDSDKGPRLQKFIAEFIGQARKAERETARHVAASEALARRREAAAEEGDIA